MIKGLSEISLKNFVSAARRAAACGLLRCSSGNMSWRINDELAAITARGCWLERLTKDDVSLCRIADGEILHGKMPSVESRFHLGILRQRADINVVLHFQSPYATAIACSARRDYDFCVLSEVPCYIGSIGFVDYILPGSKELATAVTEAVKKHNMVLLQNHGQVTVGKDFDDVIQKACFFELVCQILLCGSDLKAIPAEAAAALTNAAKNSKAKG
jgi:ribulose-5-phosphate 4-epimerase/fuculose-1-phosphate aldolase